MKMRKKNPGADLEQKRPYFFKIGLIIACAMVWTAFEWETAYATELPPDPIIEDSYDPEDEAQIMAIKFEKPIPKPPKVKTKSVTKDIASVSQIFVSDIDIDETDFEESEDVIEIAYDDSSDEEEDVVINLAMAEFKPRFPGCEDAATEDERYRCFERSIYRHIQKNFRYPAIPKDLGIQGKVMVQFVIDSSGDVVDVKVPRALDKYLDKEAIRLIKSLPKMTPARQFNKNVAVSFYVPVNFQLK